MRRCSYFIHNKALFGSYPAQSDIEELEENGVTCYVDLTCKKEGGITKYITTKRIISFPIKDNHVPTDDIMS